MRNTWDGETTYYVQLNVSQRHSGRKRELPSWETCVERKQIHDPRQLRRRKLVSRADSYRTEHFPQVRAGTMHCFVSSGFRSAVSAQAEEGVPAGVHACRHQSECHLCANNSARASSRRIPIWGKEADVNQKEHKESSTFKNLGRLPKMVDKLMF